LQKAFDGVFGLGLAAEHHDNLADAMMTLALHCKIHGLVTKQMIGEAKEFMRKKLESQAVKRPAPKTQMLEGRMRGPIVKAGPPPKTRRIQNEGQEATDRQTSRLASQPRDSTQQPRRAEARPRVYSRLSWLNLDG